MRTRCHQIKAISLGKETSRVLPLSCIWRDVFSFWVKTKTAEWSHPFIVHADSWNIKRTIQTTLTQKRTLTLTPRYLLPIIGNKGHVLLLELFLKTAARSPAYRHRGHISRRARISQRLRSFWGEATTMVCLCVCVCSLLLMPLKEHQVCFPLWASFSLHVYRRSSGTEE